MSSMRTIEYIAFAIAAAMAGVILYGFVAGDFGDEGTVILDLAWGRVSLVDIYAGIALVAAWMFYREGVTPGTTAWLAAFVVTGNFATALYVALTARKANEDHVWFWMGKRARLEVNRRSSA